MKCQALLVGNSERKIVVIRADNQAEIDRVMKKVKAQYRYVRILKTVVIDETALARRLRAFERMVRLTSPAHKAKSVVVK